MIQAGGFKVINNTEGNSLAPVETLPPIVNEFKISNIRGTVAMAKVSGNPDSATSQWFVNLADNSANLDNQNGGFAVFGRVLFDGMNMIDAISNLPLTNLDSNQGLTAVPTISTDGTQIVPVVISAIDISNTSGVFSDNTLSFAVDAGSVGILDVSLRLIEDSPILFLNLILPASHPYYCFQKMVQLTHPLKAH